MKIKKSLARHSFIAINYLLLTLLTLTFLFPMLLVVSSSLVGAAERNARGSFVLFPNTIDLSGYRALFSTGGKVLRAYGNTLFVVVVGTFLSLALTAMLAYGLTRKSLPGRRAITTGIFLTMIFSGGLVPLYLLVDFLRLMDSRWALILPGLLSAWNVFLMRNFFYSIPNALEESALLDGATPIQVFLKIILPLSKAVLAVIGMYYAVGYWNSWFPGVIYINDTAKLPMQNIMRNVISLYSAADLNEAYADLVFLERPPMQSMQMATIVVGTLPILLVYPFIQKYFVKGVMIGSIKG